MQYNLKLVTNDSLLKVTEICKSKLLFLRETHSLDSSGQKSIFLLLKCKFTVVSIAYFVIFTIATWVGVWLRTLETPSLCFSCHSVSGQRANLQTKNTLTPQNCGPYNCIKEPKKTLCSISLIHKCSSCTDRTAPAIVNNANTVLVQCSTICVAKTLSK